MIFNSMKIPEEWRNNVLLLIFKYMGDLQSCCNYRGIKPMSHTMKICERVVEMRLGDKVIISKQQYCVMPRKSTEDLFVYGFWLTVLRCTVGVTDGFKMDV